MIPGRCDGRSQDAGDDAGEERRECGKSGSSEERIGNADSLHLAAER